MGKVLSLIIGLHTLMDLAVCLCLSASPTDVKTIQWVQMDIVQMGSDGGGYCYSIKTCASFVPVSTKFAISKAKSLFCSEESYFIYVNSCSLIFPHKPFSKFILYGSRGNVII